jgi:hypothetical protein
VTKEHIRLCLYNIISARETSKQSMNGGFSGRGKPHRLAQRPKALICYICGRQYGTNSLKIHLKSCIKIWEEREMLKPKRERKPVPKAPAAIEQALNGKSSNNKRGGRSVMSATEMQAQNEAAFNAYNSNSLNACPHCGRTFLAERLEKHLLSCKPGNIMGKKLKAGSGLAGGNLGGATKTKERGDYRPHTTSPRKNHSSNMNLKNVKHKNDDKPWRNKKNNSNKLASSQQQNDKRQRNSPKITIFDGSDSQNDTIGQNIDNNNSKKFQSVSQGSEISPVDLEFNVINNSSNDNFRNAANMEDKWERAIDLKTNRPYYFNTRTGKRRWTKPSNNVDRIKMSTNNSNSEIYANGSDNNSGKGSRAGSIWSNEDDKSMDSFFEKNNFNENGASIPRAISVYETQPLNNVSKLTKQERSKSYRQRVKSTVEQSNLENRVEELESKLSFALDEISRLNKVVQRFQHAFSNLNISPRS